jgi:hypothetical protein
VSDTELDKAHKDLEQALKAIDASVPFGGRVRDLVPRADDPEERLARIERALKAIAKILELGRPH